MSALRLKSGARDMELAPTPRRGSNPLPGIPRMAKPFAGTQPHLRNFKCLRHGWRQRVRDGNEKSSTLLDAAFKSLERATGLEPATSTLARWRSTR